MLYNPDDMLLMMKDRLVMAINFDEGKYYIFDNNLLPFDLKGRIQEPYPEKETYTKYDITQMNIISRKNYSAVLSFLSHRVLPITRANAKKIYSLFGFEQGQSEIDKAKIAIVCRAVSLQDNYWLTTGKDLTIWDEVNLRTNSLSEIVAQVALHGTSLSLTGTPTTPELTSLGAYAKAWVREPDGLYLHKLGSDRMTDDGPVTGVWESKIEVMVSKLLDKCNVSHLKYEEGHSINSRTLEEVYTCKCKCMTSEDISILSGMDFNSYCNVHGIDPYKEAIRIDPEGIYKMWIVDYLISNRDRHGLNWGFFYDCNTMEIIGCHPLYDHNNSFDIQTMEDRDREYLYDQRMTMRQAAKFAMSEVDFHFTSEITRSDFLTDRQYKEFMWRAKDLGIETKSDFLSGISAMTSI